VVSTSVEFHKRKILVFAFGIIGIGLFWVLISRIGIPEMIAVIRQLAWWKVLSVALFPIVSFVIAASRLRWILGRIDGAGPSLFKLVGYLFAGTSVSMVVPSMALSGETAKGLLLQRSGVLAPRAFAAIFWDSFSRFAANIGITFFLLASIFASGILPFGGVSWNLAVLWGMGGLLLAAVVLRRRLRRGGFFTAMAERMFRGRLSADDLAAFDRFVSEFALHKTAVLVPFGISFVGYLWEIAQSRLILGYLGIDITLPAVLVWHVVTNFARVLPAPSGVGFAEGAGVLVAGLFSASPGAGLAFVVVSRIRDLAILTVGATVVLVERLIGRKISPFPPFNLRRAKTEAGRF
jgi:uncharacterized protein (TIRG00374 family)